MSSRDLATLVAAWLVSTSIVLLWVHRTRQNVVPRSWAHSRMIAIRTCVLFGLTSLVFVGGLGLPATFVSAVTTFVVLLLPVTTLGALEAADSAQGMAILVMVVVPLVVLRQYVLGNPEIDGLVLKPPPVAERERIADEHSAEGVLATAVTPLRPAGFVELAGRRAEARSHDGRFIDVGSVVQVCGRRNRQHLVRPVSPSAETPPSVSTPVAPELANFDGQPNSTVSNDS